MPVLVWQMLAFVGPGADEQREALGLPDRPRREPDVRRRLRFAYYVELPPALNFLLDPPGDVATPLISVKSYIDFVTRLMLVTGLVFETPLLVMGLAKIGVVHVAQAAAAGGASPSSAPSSSRRS